MNTIELAREAGVDVDTAWGVSDAALERFAALVRAQALEEAARKRAKPPRKLPKCGSGALLDEQQYCYELGYREGAAALRAAIRALAKEKT
jgi:hypothetical protein